MKLLVNDKEISNFLINKLDLISSCQQIAFTETNTAEAIQFVLDRKDNPKFYKEQAKMRDKCKDKITKCVKKDLEIWIRKIEQQIENYRNHHYHLIHKHIEYFVEKLGEQKIIDEYISSNVDGYIKTIGLQIDPNASMVRRKHFSDAREDCLLRNTVGNEKLLIDKIDNNLPFWFIDSGYTNFIESNKKWHRLVRNHLHFNKDFQAPSDRLSNFKTFPKPWKKTGSKILVVEPGSFAANIFHTDINVWKNQVVNELRKYTDRPIEFREKINKKTRTSLHELLLTGDYYCTVSINSNSAVESIWAGVPAITLGKHISNPVTVNSLDKVNDLYRGPLGNWLSWLSYCQFTYDELMNGDALSMIREYHNV